ncbi:MAG: CobW family GTP-binding protein [Burkholderiaceae bacterium]
MTASLNQQAVLPVTIIGGYLGAGKTTLVNTLLRNANGKRLAVLVNDFGDISIDAELIESADDQVINLAGGCVCCSIGSDLVTSLGELQNRFNNIDHILLETSGVALPGVVAATVTLAPQVRRDGVIVVCDALNGPRWLADPYIADTVERQITAADCLVLTKEELVAPAQADQFSNQLANLSPSAPQLSADEATLPALLLDQLTTAGMTRDRPDSPASTRAFHPHSGPILESRHYFCDKPIDLTDLQAALASPPGGIFRAKGIFSGTSDELFLLQCVAGRSVLTRWMRATEHLGHLIVISALSAEQLQKLETLLRNLGFCPYGRAMTLNQNQKTGKIQS